MAQPRPIIKAVDGTYVIVAHVECFKRHDRSNSQSGQDLWAVIGDSAFKIIEDTNDRKEQQLFDNIGHYVCTDEPMDLDEYY